jgi:hypothetical protein
MQNIDNTKYIIGQERLHTTKGLALCRRTETQFSTLVHVASVVSSLTDIAEQQNLNFN